jgi:hypothetical protein
MTHPSNITLQSMQVHLPSFLVRTKSIWLDCWPLLKITKWDCLFSKEGVSYHEVVDYNKIQNLFSALVMIVISKTPMHPLISPLVISTMLLRSPPIKSFLLLDTPLLMFSRSFQNYLLTTSLKPTWGIHTNGVQNQIPNHQFDHDDHILLSYDIDNSILKVFYQLRWLHHSCFIFSHVPWFEACILHLFCILTRPFNLLNA